MLVRAFETADVPAMRDIWNEVVRAENAFPQVGELKSDEAEKFFAAQSFSGVAVDDDGRVLGLCIVHPNNIGRCGVIANASYAVASSARGKGAGEALVRESLKKAKTAPIEHKIIMLAEKLSNIRSTYREYQKMGDAVFERFNVKDKESHAWYERGCLDALSELKNLPQYSEYAHLVSEIYH